MVGVLVAVTERAGVFLRPEDFLMIRVDYLFLAISAGLLLACCTGCPTQRAANTKGKQSARDTLVTVQTRSPERTSLPRTMTQPATVHAYFQAEVYAKVAGYLQQLNVDIGDVVKEGDTLAVIGVPELVKQHERQQATVERLQAELQRTQAAVELAVAGVEAAVAAHDQVQAEIAKAAAQLKAYQAEYTRVQGLVSEKAVASRLLDEAREHFESAQAAKQAAEAAVRSADANVTVAKANLSVANADLEVSRARIREAEREQEETAVLLDYATLRAPFDGIVTERNVDPGDLVRDTQAASTAPHQPLFTIAGLDRVRVRVPVPEDDAEWLTVGDPATVHLRGLPGRAPNRKVSRAAGSLDENTRTMTVEIDVPNPDGSLLPGMFGEATITLEEKADALVLPATAIRHDESGRSYVYVVAADDAILVVDVTTGLDDGKQVEIVSGLTGSERVVGPTIDRLKPGQKVRVQ